MRIVGIQSHNLACNQRYSSVPSVGLQFFVDEFDLRLDPIPSDVCTGWLQPANRKTKLKSQK